MGLFNGLMGSFGYVRNSNGSNWYSVTKNNTTYLNGKDKLDLAINHSTLSSVISIRADYLSKAKFYIEDDNGEKDFNHESLQWLKNPNPHQSGEDFLIQYEWFLCAYGWLYQRPYLSSIKDGVNQIYNLNPSQIQFPNKMGDSLILTKSDKKKYYDKEFSYKDIENDKSIRFSDVIPYFDVTSGISNTETSAVTSPSRIDSIIKEASNVSLASDAENIVIETNGREMIFSDQTGAALGGSLPLDDGDRKTIKDTLNKPLSRGSRTLTPSKKLGWVNMSVKLGDLGLNQSRETNSNIISQRFQVPNEIYKAFTTGATFENQKEAQVGFVQNTMQPRADNLAASWTSSFGDVNRPFKASYDHLPSMQILEAKRAEKALKITTSMRNLVQAGLTEADAREFMSNMGIQFEK